MFIINKISVVKTFFGGKLLHNIGVSNHHLISADEAVRFHHLLSFSSRASPVRTIIGVVRRHSECTIP
jgi:hypothetical protein